MAGGLQEAPGTMGPATHAPAGSSHLEYTLDLLLINKIQQRKGWEVTSKIKLQKDCGLSLPLSLGHCKGSWLLCCELPDRETRVSRNRCLPPAYSQPGPEASQQPCKQVWKRILSQLSLQKNAAPASTFTASLQEILSQSHPAKPRSDL